VDQNAEIAAEIRAWMLRVMEQTGLSVSAWAEKAGDPPPHQHECTFFLG
jgi:hypothetical protein